MSFNMEFVNNLNDIKNMKLIFKLQYWMEMPESLVEER